MKTRDKIIYASLELFNEHGERNITTNHIAAHLNMSPGNLYYHFRNKEDIIRCIFSLYENHLESGFQPYEDKQVDVELLIGYFDAMFYTLWQFRFMYANLADILARDEELKKRYLHAQQQVLTRSSHVLHKLKQDGFLNLESDKITPLADTIKMIVSFWIGYQLTQSSTSTITKATLYEGVLRVLMIFKAYATPTSVATFTRLEQHYHALASQESL
ncbi:TetR/AcrR family transcriptional regulator [Shewanella sp. SP2S2-4]|jgi:AcrR family transcriptional regulator|uniref:Transcriptional regulator, TetR family n=1 Tax=Shewanella baltica (strain OS195) TaxID=399599 RepID=A9KWX8_SHEB9|nr:MULTISPECIES: TetR/AcrR family transcriptional regulator [Shewanella]MBU1394163.1 TetR/AcrR family transcriptional regulator [Gammaproteobacteria bacterium]ABX51636.1 transcriptional regulator, TetR family [Shewanella baltica OS195]ADT96631.1 regulatory protein TetR [Shewanella baltica OS678]EHC07456.1 regulatory protein TetR [Shewanella baltica OS625]MBU1479467.1 TetR/AcrR family transcriptional regulator [Gammaproteobacteria bacterium]